MAETGEDDKEAPAELQKPSEEKKKPAVEEEEKKPAPKKEEPQKEDNEREDKDPAVKPVEEKPETEEEKAPAAGKGKKNSTKEAEPVITDTHDRKHPLKRIREWTKPYEGKTIDVDEHYSWDTYNR